MATHRSNEPHWDFAFCPRPPDWSLDWDAIVASFDWVQAMEGCAQDPIWHAEGDVLTHTRMVCEALMRLDTWRAVPAVERSILFAATLMHDMAKPIVSRDEGGRVTARRHAARGALMARTMWMTGAASLPRCTFAVREEIVGLVRHHGVPLYFADGDDPRREVFTAAEQARCDRTALIAEADVLGRECDDQQELMAKVDFFREYCREQQCYRAPRDFASDHTRFLYFHGRDLDPDCPAYDDTSQEVLVMSGLPGAGKDHWIRSQGPDWPVVSLDEIREELRLAPVDNQGAVVSQAKEKARRFLREGTSFIWNATNTTKAMRRQLIQLFRDYNARVRIVYVEAPWNEILRRNRVRETSVPESVLEKLAGKLEVPDTTEAHAVEYIVS